MIPEIMAIATKTASRAAKALPNLNFSNSRANGKSEIEIKVAKSKGINKLCETYINPRINTNAKRLDAKLMEYGFLDGCASIFIWLIVLCVFSFFPIINIQ